MGGGGVAADEVGVSLEGGEKARLVADVPGLDAARPPPPAIIDQVGTALTDWVTTPATGPSGRHSAYPPPTRKTPAGGRGT